MPILFRYILREVIVSSLIGTLLFTFVLFLKSVGLLMELLIRPERLGRGCRLPLPVGPAADAAFHDSDRSADRGFGGIGARFERRRDHRHARGRAFRVAGSWAPVAVLALVGGVICAATTIYYNPLALTQQKKIAESLKISRASAEVQPRVFIETFPNTILYVRDVIPGPVVRWKGVFIADERSPEDRGSFAGANAAVDGPRITVAEEAVVVPRPEQDRLQVRLAARFYLRAVLRRDAISQL